MPFILNKIIYMCCDEKFLEKIAYVLASKHRQNLILFIGDNFYTPSLIGKGINIRTNHTSNLLTDLKNNNIIYCATPQVHKGRLYGLTDDGKKILEYLKNTQK